MEIRRGSTNKTAIYQQPNNALDVSNYRSGKMKKKNNTVLSAIKRTFLTKCIQQFKQGNMNKTFITKQDDIAFTELQAPDVTAVTLLTERFVGLST